MPKQIGIHYQYFGDADLPIDEDVVRRIRKDWDDAFVPVLKKELYQYETGDRVVFRNFGIGLEERPGLDVLNQPVYQAEKPASGYLSTIGRAIAIVEWWPWQRSEDGTPGPTKPFGEWVYAYMRDQTYEMRRLESLSTVRDGFIPNEADAIRAAAIKAMAQQAAENMQAQAKESARVIAEAEAEYMAEAKYVMPMLTELTDDEWEALKSLSLQNKDQRVGKVSFAMPGKSPSKIILP